MIPYCMPVIWHDLHVFALWELDSMRKSGLPLSKKTQWPLGNIVAILKVHRQTYIIRSAKSKHFNVSRLVLQLQLTNPLKPGVKSRMKMSALFELHRSDQQFYCLLRCH